MSEELDAQALKAQQVAADQRTIEIEELRAVLNTPAGLNTLRRLIGRAGLFRLSYDRDSERQTCLREGERNIGLWLLAEVGRVDPKRVADLLRIAEQTEKTA